MTRSLKRICLVIGFLFLAGGPVCYFGAAAYAYAQPRLYRAATEFQLLFPAADEPRLPDTFEQAREQYPARVRESLTARVELKESGLSDQYRIVAIDANPQSAANAANTLTIFVADALRAADKEGGKHIAILQKAEAPKVPSFPNVLLIMRLGVFAGSACACLGIVLLVIAFRA